MNLLQLCLNTSTTHGVSFSCYKKEYFNMFNILPTFYLIIAIEVDTIYQNALFGIQTSVAQRSLLQGLIFKDKIMPSS